MVLVNAEEPYFVLVRYPELLARTTRTVPSTFLVGVAIIMVLGEVPQDVVYTKPVS
jgi:hypothetical protein